MSDRQSFASRRAERTPPSLVGNNPVSRRGFLQDLGMLGAAGAIATTLRRPGGKLSNPSRVAMGKRLTVIELWSWYTEEDPVWQSIQGDFHDEYPSLGVTIRTFDSISDYLPAIESAISGGKAPDILATANLALPYGGSGHLVDLRKELGSSFLNQFFPSINAQYSLGDNQYGIGWEAQMFGLFYDPALLEKAKIDFPETWDDLLTSAPALHKAGLKPLALSGDPNNNAVDFFLPLITQASNDPNLCMQLDMLTERGVSWDSPPVIDAFTMFEKLVRAGVFESNVNVVTSFDALALFYGQRSAMLSAGSSVVPFLTSLGGRVFDADYRVGMWPAWKSGGKHWSAGQAETGWSVNAHANVDAALTFLKWLYQPERYAGIMSVSDSLPATARAAADASNHRQRLMASWMKDNGCYHILNGTGSEAAVGNVVGSVLDGKLGPAAAAAAVEAQVKALRTT